jgi:protoporphyrinogen/coproporphyrinogen III oxidase
MIVIIGGGITGLAAAFELSRRGADFLLLEASSHLGGLIRTEQVDGFTIDAGPDSLLVQKPAAIQLCEQLGLSSRLMATKLPRTAFVLRDRRLFSLPSPSVLGIPTSLLALSRYELLDWPARLRIALEPLIPQGPAADESVAAFFRRRFGAASVGLIAEPLLGGIHAGDVEQLSMTSVFPRLTTAARQPGGIARNLGRTPRGEGGGMFRALRGGMGELVSGIARTLPAQSLRLDTPVTRIERSGAAWKITAGTGGVDAAAVLMAAPAHTIAGLIRPVDEGAAQVCESVPYVSTASVALAWRRGDVAHPLEGSGFVVARRYNDVRITACTWVSSKWEHRAPEGSVLIRAFAGGAHDPGAVNLSDAELIDTAVRDLTPILGISAAPQLTRVFRARDAGAQHHVGHTARMALLAQRLSRMPGLFAAGSGFESIGIPDCVANGRRAAAAAADYVRMGT